MDDTQSSRDEVFSPACSSVHQKKSEPEPSCVSMRSDGSMGLPLKFSSVHQKRSEPEPSCVSMRSDGSMGQPLKFSSVHQKRSEPEPSCVSMRSDGSMGLPLKFSSVHQKRSESEPSCVSMRSDGSMSLPLEFRLSDCDITDEDCAALASALRSNPSHLRELDLSMNKIGKSVNLLSDVLQDPHCKLEKLRLSDCDITDEGCATLASALRSNLSHLRELSLSWNKISKSVNLLSDVLADPHCKLEKLWLRCCGFTDEGCAALTSALRSNPSHLRVLNLSGNKMGQSVNLLSAVLADPHCKLEKLWLMGCGITGEGCAALASALRSNPSHLRYLDLTDNKLGQSGVKLLSDLKDDPHYKLKELKYCRI